MSNLKTSKIVNIQGSGTFETQHGMFFNYDMQMENGDSGEYASKNYTSVDALPFKVGTDIDYEWHPHEKFPKIKRPTIAGTKRFDPNKSFKSSSSRNNDPDVQIMIVRQSSLERSVDILSHNNVGKRVKLSDVLLLASELTQFVVEGTKFDPSKKEESYPPPAPIPTPQPDSQLRDAIKESMGEDDDLPF